MSSVRSKADCVSLRQLVGMIHKAEDNIAVMQRSGRNSDARYESFRLQGLMDAAGCFSGCLICGVGPHEPCDAGLHS